MTSASTGETTRPVTLFTGQWADLTLEEIAEYASEWGYDGLRAVRLTDAVLDSARSGNWIET